MSTKPKTARRLTLTWQRTGSDGDLAFLEWAGGGSDVHGLAAELGRGHYLRALSAIRVNVLRDLRSIAVGDAAELQEWARKYHLPAQRDSWALAWARQTIALSRGRYWCPPIDDGAGKQIADELTPRALTRQERARLAPQVNPAAFRWLAEYQATGKPFLSIALWHGTSHGNVRRDCQKIAELIDLPLRKAARGRQPRKRSTSRPE